MKFLTKITNKLLKKIILSVRISLGRSNHYLVRVLNMKSISPIQPNTTKDTFMTYKHKPLVRCGDTIYYGSMEDKYVVKMEVKDFILNNDLKISSRIHIEMIETNLNISDTKKIVKISEKSGLYDAMDIAQVWLERAKNLNS